MFRSAGFTASKKKKLTFARAMQNGDKCSLEAVNCPLSLSVDEMSLLMEFSVALCQLLHNCSNIKWLSSVFE